MKIRNLSLSLLLLTTFSPVFSQTPVSTPQIEIGFIEKQGDYVALDTKLINEEGDTVVLGDLMGKPTILSMVYYRCPGTCSPLMWGIAKFIEEVDLIPGEDYQILTISFDPTEDISLGIQKKANYVASLKNKSLGDDWHFFVGDSANIARLTESIGFRYKWIVDQYSHPTGLIALAPDGKITRYLRGIEFLPFDIKITMVEAAQGKIGLRLTDYWQFVTHMIRTKNQMVFNVTKVAGILIMFFGLVIFLILVLMKRKK